MNCHQASALLSNYFDGELSGGRRSDLEEHLTNCRDCSLQLAFFAKLSEAFRKLSIPALPREMLWQRIAVELNKFPGESNPLVVPSTVNEPPTKLRWAIMSTAAIVLIAIGLSFGVLSRQPHHEELQRYAALLESEPQVAQQYLAKQYSGQTVSAGEAVKLIGYRPRNVQTPPSGFVFEKLVVLDMPCCKCIQAIWRRPDQSQLAVFEHRSQMDDWFADDPSIRIECAGAVCRITQLDGQLAATWRVGTRVITVIGVKNTDELAKLIRTLSWRS